MQGTLIALTWSRVVNIAPEFVHNANNGLKRCKVDAHMHWAIFFLYLRTAPWRLQWRTCLDFWAVRPEEARSVKHWRRVLSTRSMNNHQVQDSTPDQDITTVVIKVRGVGAAALDTMIPSGTIATPQTSSLFPRCSVTFEAFRLNEWMDSMPVSRRRQKCTIASRLASTDTCNQTFTRSSQASRALPCITPVVDCTHGAPAVVLISTPFSAISVPPAAAPAPESDGSVESDVSPNTPKTNEDGGVRNPERTPLSVMPSLSTSPGSLPAKRLHSHGWKEVQANGTATMPKVQKPSAVR